MAKIDSLSELDEYYAEKIEKQEKKKKSGKVALIFIIIISIIIGIVVYKVVDHLVNGNQPVEEEFIGEQLSLDNENVQILYDYVTSGYDGNRITKFVMTSEVGVQSFSNLEKIQYALQFAQPEDFVFTGQVNENKQKIYSFSDRLLQKYLGLYFGEGVVCEPESHFTYPFLFYINQKNEGKFTYNASSAGYDVVFDSRYEFPDRSSTIPPVYGKLISALVQPDGSVVLQERVVYTELRTDNGGFAIDIYKDPKKEELLTTKKDLTEESLKTFQIDFSEFTSTAIVEYTFDNNGNNLYFSSSRIIL